MKIKDWEEHAQKYINSGLAIPARLLEIKPSGATVPQATPLPAAPASTPAPTAATTPAPRYPPAPTAAPTAAPPPAPTTTPTTTPTAEPVLVPSSDVPQVPRPGGAGRPSRGAFLQGLGGVAEHVAKPLGEFALSNLARDVKIALDLEEKFIREPVGSHILTAATRPWEIPWVRSIRAGEIPLPKWVPGQESPELERAQQESLERFRDAPWYTQMASDPTLYGGGGALLHGAGKVGKLAGGIRKGLAGAVEPPRGVVKESAGVPPGPVSEPVDEELIRILSGTDRPEVGVKLLIEARTDQAVKILEEAKRLNRPLRVVQTEDQVRQMGKNILDNSALRREYAKDLPTRVARLVKLTDKEMEDVLRRNPILSEKPPGRGRLDEGPSPVLSSVPGRIVGAGKYLTKEVMGYGAEERLPLGIAKGVQPDELAKAKAVADETAKNLTESMSLARGRKPLPTTERQPLVELTADQLKEQSRAHARVPAAIQEITARRLKAEFPRATEEGIQGFLKGSSRTAARIQAASDPERLVDYIVRTGLTTKEQNAAKSAVNNFFSGAKIKGEDMALLQRIFGSRFGEAMRNTADNGVWRALHEASEFSQIPRAVMASYDMSAPLRQGIVLAYKHPEEAGIAFVNMVRSWGSETQYRNMLESVYTDGRYMKAREHNLFLSGLTNAEEVYATKWMRALRIAPGFRMSERAYNTFLIKLRMDVFKYYDDVIDDAFKSRNLGDGGRLAGRSKDDLLNQAAEWINIATGRGSLPGDADRFVALTNPLLFAPRLLISRAQVPLYILPRVLWGSKDNPISRQIAYDMGSFVAGTGLTLTLASMAGARVEKDPRSSKFGQMQIGNSTLDTTGGFRTLFTNATKILFQTPALVGIGERGVVTKTAYGKLRKSDKDMLHTIGRFYLSKASPPVSMAQTHITGETFMGEPASFSDVAMQMLPLGYQETLDAFNAQGLTGIALSAGPFFGAGMTTYDEDLYPYKLLGYGYFNTVTSRRQAELWADWLGESTKGRDRVRVRAESERHPIGDFISRLNKDQEAWKRANPELAEKLRLSGDYKTDEEIRKEEGWPDPKHKKPFINIPTDRI